MWMVLTVMQQILYTMDGIQISPNFYVISGVWTKDIEIEYMPEYRTARFFFLHEAI
jgi:hypothetical protein